MKNTAKLDELFNETLAHKGFVIGKTFSLGMNMRSPFIITENYEVIDSYGEDLGLSYLLRNECELLETSDHDINFHLLRYAGGHKFDKDHHEKNAYMIAYDVENGDASCLKVENMAFKGAIYFDNEEDCLNAIETFSKEEWAMYFGIV